MACSIPTQCPQDVVHLEVVSQRLELAGAGQRAGQVQERREEVGAALVADGEPPVGQQPGQRAYDVHRWRPSRWLDSTLGRAIRGQIPRRRSALRQLG
jgi:hypothetical protein